MFDLLGWKVKDRVTGYTGVVTHIGLDLYGCVQGIVWGTVRDDGKPAESAWFDLVRLERVGDQRVMEPVPMKGAAPEGTAGPEANKPTK
jgi:hypothetical protein